MAFNCLICKKCRCCSVIPNSSNIKGPQMDILTQDTNFDCRNTGPTDTHLSLQLLSQSSIFQLIVLAYGSHRLWFGSHTARDVDSGHFDLVSSPIQLGWLTTWQKRELLENRLGLITGLVVRNDLSVYVSSKIIRQVSTPCSLSLWRPDAAGETVGAREVACLDNTWLGQEKWHGTCLRSAPNDSSHMSAHHSHQHAFQESGGRSKLGRELETRIGLTYGQKQDSKWMPMSLHVLISFIHLFTHSLKETNECFRCIDEMTDKGKLKLKCSLCGIHVTDSGFNTTQAEVAATVRAAETIEELSLPLIILAKKLY